VTRPVWTSVEKVFRRALELRPDALAVRYHLGKALRTHDVEGAIQQWQQVYRAEPDYGEVRKLLVSVLDERISELQKKKHFGAMETSARLMLELAPDDFRAKGDLGMALMGQVSSETPSTSRPLRPDQIERLDESITLLERATAETSYRVRYRPALVDALSLRRHWARAIEAAREMTRDSKPGMQEAGWSRIAGVAMGTGDLEGALEAYEKSLAVGHECPVAKQARHRQDWLLRMMGRTTEALRRAKARMAAAPNDILGYTYAAGCLIELGRIKEAETLLSQPRLMRFIAVGDLVGVCRALQGDLDGAKEHWSRNLAAMDKGLAVRKQRGQTTADWHKRIADQIRGAYVHLQCRNGWEGYAFLAAELAKRAPEVDEYRAMEIRALSRLGRVDDGLSLALKRVGHNPFSSYWHMYVQLLMPQSKRIESYSEKYEKRVAEKPDDASVWMLVGHVRFAQERFDDALAAYNQAIELRPRLFTPHELISTLHVASRDPAAGLAANRRAAEANPHAHSSWTNIGFRLIELHRYEEAHAPLDRVLASNEQAFVASALRCRGVAEFGSKGPEAGLNYAREHFLVRPHGTGWEPGFVYALLNAELFDGVIACFEYLRKQRPDSALIRGWFAWALTLCPEGKGWDSERAVRLSREAVEAMPDSHLLWATHGFALSRAGAHEESLRAFAKHKALSGDGRIRYKRWRKAISLWHLGRKQDARLELERADRDVYEQELDVGWTGASFVIGESLEGAFAALRKEAHDLIE